MNRQYPVTNNQSFGFGATGNFLQNIKEGPQYNKTCKTLINAIPTVQGTIYKRSGFVGFTLKRADRDKLNALNLNPNQIYKACILEPDEFYRYILIFYPGKLIGYPIYDQKVQADIENITDLELTVIDTPFDEDDLRNMFFNRRKLEVIVYTTNHIEQVVRIERKVGETKWVLAMQPFSYQIMPMLPQNEDLDNTVHSTGIDGVQTITWRKDTLKPGHVGAQFGFYHAPWGRLWTAETDIGNDMYCFYGDNVYRRVHRSGEGNNTTSKNPPTHNIPGEIESDGNLWWEYLNSGMGYAVLREYIDAKTGKFEIIIPLPIQMEEPIDGTLAVWRWNESAFSNVRGWASCGVTWSWNDGERIIVSGVNRFRLKDTWTDPVTKTTQIRDAHYNMRSTRDTEPYSPDERDTSDTMIFGSRVGDYGNFDIYNASNESAFSYSLSAERECKILWLVSAHNLIVGTTAGIFEYEMLTGVQVKSLDFVKDSLSRHVPGTYSSNVLYYVSNSENCLKIVTTDVNGANQNSSVSDRAQELTRGITQLVSVETDKNHLMMLRDNGTITGLYFDASEQTNMSGMYQIVLEENLQIKAIDTIYLESSNDMIHQSYVKAQVLLMVIFDPLTYGYPVLVAGYINLNQAPAPADKGPKDTLSSHFRDTYIVRGPTFTRVNFFFYPLHIGLHKQGFFNPGHPYGDISQGSVVKYIACNTYNTTRKPVINDCAPSNMSIIPPTDMHGHIMTSTDDQGQPLPGIGVEVVYHYSMNHDNMKPLFISDLSDRYLCIINMDITLDVSERG